MRRRALLLDLMIAMALAAAILGAVAVAHPAGKWYKFKWAPGDRTQHYGFADAVPGGNLRDRVEGGARQWNTLGPNMQARRGGVNVNFAWNNCSNRDAGDNSIHWGGIDGGPKPGQFNIYAQATWCVYSDNRDRLYTSQIKFDKAENWYKGTGDPGNNQVDAWAVATHEFGHFFGFKRHFKAGSAACGSPKQTMCQGLPLGAKFWRSLEEHDRHTFRNAYG